MYKNVVSLGHLCWTAEDMERNGFRSASGPFDWVVSENLEKVMELLKNHFVGFMEFDNLYQNQKYRYIYKDVKYQIEFSHDFNEYLPLKKQYSIVKEKYRRRIERFLDTIQNPTVFIRYISSMEEKLYIDEHYLEINMVLKGYNENNEILYITSDELDTQNYDLYKVIRDDKISTTRYPIQKNAALYYKLVKLYNPNERQNNQRFLQKKKTGNIFKRRIVSKVKSIIRRKYRHQQSY